MERFNKALALQAQNNSLIVAHSTMRATIKAGTVATTGLRLENKNDYNDKQIIGMYVRVNADASDVKRSKEGNLLIIQDWAEQTFLTIQNNNTLILDQIPLSKLIPATGEVYVKVWIPKFSPSTSKFTFTGNLTDGTDDRDIEIGFIHDEILD